MGSDFGISYRTATRAITAACRRGPVDAAGTAPTCAAQGAAGSMYATGIPSATVGITGVSSAAGSGSGTCSGTAAAGAVAAAAAAPSVGAAPGTGASGWVAIGGVSGAAVCAGEVGTSGGAVAITCAIWSRVIGPRR